MFNSILMILLVFLLPFFINSLEKKVKIIQWLSPVVWSYFLGILLGNFSSSIPYLEWDQTLARTLSEVSLMLALPMLLLVTDFMGWLKLARSTIFSFVIFSSCVFCMSLLFGYLFKDAGPDVWKMAGMITGVYIGGTPNLTAVGKMLEINDETFIALNAADVLIGSFYLFFILSVGVKVLSLFLPEFKFDKNNEAPLDLLNWKKLSVPLKLRNAFVLIILCLLLAGGSLFLTKMITGEESLGPLFLFLTLFSISLSFIPKVRHFEGSQECGHYFLLVFCLATGSMANVNEIMTGKGWYFLLCGLVLLGSVVLHFLCCYFLKIDRDTAVITSMAGIYGPAFIAPMSDVLKNRSILVSGITCSLVGIALGNFIGLAVSYILK